MTQHQLIGKYGDYRCKVCNQKWKGKPRSECPEITVYPSSSSSLKTLDELRRINLKPTGKPIGCCYKSRRIELLYDIKNTVKIDINLPPAFDPLDVKIVKGELQCIWDLRGNGLEPSPETTIKGVVSFWNKEKKDYIWQPLYDPKDCVEKTPFLTKSQLKSKYLLSDGWVKRIGKPDLIKQNPHYRNSAPMQLYNQRRVEHYLKTHAQDYANWLERRKKLQDHFERNRQKILGDHGSGGFADRYQKKLCQKCQSGTYVDTPQGKIFLCVVHPMGLDTFPCPDFFSR